MTRAPKIHWLALVPGVILLLAAARGWDPVGGSTPAAAAWVTVTLLVGAFGLALTASFVSRTEERFGSGDWTSLGVAGLLGFAMSLFLVASLALGTGLAALMRLSGVYRADGVSDFAVRLLLGLTTGGAVLSIAYAVKFLRGRLPGRAAAAPGPSPPTEALPESPRVRLLRRTSPLPPQDGIETYEEDPMDAAVTRDDRRSFLGRLGFSFRAGWRGPDSSQTMAEQTLSLRVTVEVNCPVAVAPGRAAPFRVLRPERRSVGGRSTDPEILTVQLIAPGFELHGNDTWRRQVSLTTAATLLPAPAAEYWLSARPVSGPEAAEVRSVQFVFSSAGEVLSAAERLVAVARDPELLGRFIAGLSTGPASLLKLKETYDPASVLKLQETYDEVRSSRDRVRPRDVAVPPEGHAHPADLTVRICRIRGEPEGNLSWSMESRHDGVRAGLDRPDWAYVGDKADDFARSLVKRISAQEGKPDGYRNLLGVADEIRVKIPPAFWSALREAFKAVGGRPPTVLILSEDSYIPWELARMEGDLLDPEAPPILAAQAVVGRWLLDREGSLPRPAPVEKKVDRLAFFKAEFGDENYARLADAEKEVDDLAGCYGGAPINATLEAVIRRLDTVPGDDVLHFSLHGNYDPQGTEDGLILVGASPLSPANVRGRTMKSAPFVFLNACQVGAGAEQLASPSGMAEAFVYAGASAVVAPLWTIQDEASGEVARRFYREAVSSPAAAVLRGIRAGFREPGGVDPTSLTLLAYRFFGHPEFRLGVKPVAARPAPPPPPTPAPAPVRRPGEPTRVINPNLPGTGAP